MSLFPPRPPKKKRKRGNPPSSPYTQRIPLDEAMKLLRAGVTRSSEIEQEKPHRRLIYE